MHNMPATIPGMMKKIMFRERKSIKIIIGLIHANGNGKSEYHLYYDILAILLFDPELPDPGL